MFVNQNVVYKHTRFGHLRALSLNTSRHCLAIIQAEIPLTNRA